MNFLGKKLMVSYLVLLLIALLFIDYKCKGFTLDKRYRMIVTAILEKKYLGYRPIGSDTRTYIYPESIRGNIVYGRDFYGGKLHQQVFIDLDKMSEVIIYSNWWEKTALEHAYGANYKNVPNN